MYGRKQIHRAAVLLTAIAALAFLVASAQAANSRPGMTQAEYRALLLRSEALNRQYGLGSGTYRPESMTAAEYRALVLRSQALNAKYGLGKTRVAASPRPAVTVGQNGFVWGDFAIGAAAMLGLVLVAVGLLAGSRRIPRARVSS